MAAVGGAAQAAPSAAPRQGQAQGQQPGPKIEWNPGFHPPKGVSALDVYQGAKTLPGNKPSPEALLDASKSPSHVLHQHFWSEPDAVWAHRGRLAESRHIISGIRIMMPSRRAGGAPIPIRAIEHIPKHGWVFTEQIVQSPSLMKAYLNEVQKLMDQAQAKLSKALSV